MSSIICSTCGAISHNENELEIHITVDHLDWVPFHCYYCQFVRLPTEFTLRTHLKEQHPDRDVMLVYKINDAKREQLSRMVAESVASLTLLDRQSQIHNEKKCARPQTSNLSAANDDQLRSDRSRSSGSDPVLLSPSPPPIKAEAVDFHHQLFAPSVKAMCSSEKDLAVSAAQQSQIQSSNEAHNGLNPFVISAQSALNTNNSNTSGCQMCGQQVGLTSNEQTNHVTRNHMKMFQFRCTQCSYNCNTYNQAYFHAKDKHQMQKNRLSIFIDLRKQYRSKTEATTKRCFPDTNSIDSNRVGMKRKYRSRSRMSLPVSAVGKISKALGTRSSSYSKETACTMCSVVIRGTNPHYFEQHVAASHFEEKFFHCKQCDFVSSRRQQVTKHLENTGHEIEDRQDELRDTLLKVVRQCFLVLS